MLYQANHIATPRLLNAVVSVILIAFPTLILLVPSGGSAPYHLAAVIGLVCLITRRPGLPRELGTDERLACLAYGAFTLAVLVSLGETGFRRDAVRELDVLLRPLWAIPILYLLIRARVAEALLWFGIALGAILVGLIAIFEFFTIDNFQRAEGGTSAIIFGNTALLMGMTSAVGVPYFKKIGSFYLIIPVAALMLGLLASFLSGSRGGWVALPALILLLLWHFRRIGYNQVALITAAVLIIVIVSVMALPQIGVTHRIDLALVEFNQYTDDPVKHGNTSVGVRLELWRAAWAMFLEQPFFGGGIGNSFNVFSQEQVALGNYHPKVATATMPHNVFFDTLALQGLVGIAGLLGIWGALGIVFVNAARARATELRTLGTAGLMLIVSYFLFGLTDSVMGYGPPLVFFSLYSALIVYLITEVRHKING